MSQYLQNFNVEKFLNEIWQRKHLLIKQGFENFENPISADELAGLSLEECVESRIIHTNIHKNGSNEYTVEHGPFDEKLFEQLPQKNWSLLVQAVDHYADELAMTRAAFRFIPDWRFDDIMISFAPTGGSVGPHFDQYDVFLIQASGLRRWKIGQHCDDSSQLTDNPDIKILKKFSQENEYLLEAGDILYIPPGCAHWGISESDDCMTISIGFRAPSHEDLISQLCDDVASKISSDKRYQDQILHTNNHPAEITSETIKNITQIITEHLLNAEAIADSFGKLMTEPKYLDEQEIFIPTGSDFFKRLDARLAYFKSSNDITIFANGVSFKTELENEYFIQNICDSLSLNSDQFENSSQQQIIEQLIQVNFFEDISEDCDVDCDHDHH